jgi:DOPA 4,5-dioxygenase
MGAPAPAISDYHAHIYYRSSSRGTAAHVRRALAERFEVVIGRWHDRPVGPHPEPMFQAAFPVTEFPRLVPWLMLHRAGLIVLIHPNTGDPLADHRDHGMWLGDRLPLDLAALDRPVP